MQKKIIIGAVAVVVLLGAGLLIYVHGGGGGTPLGAPAAATSTSQVPPGTAVAPSTLKVRSAPAGQKEYASATYKFSVFYPQELAATEYSEAIGGRTISFENADGSKGFQIYITPYGSSQIPQSRILYDTHNTATTPQEVVLADGTHALIFFSQGGALGKMREVWFVHGNYLFEVTTYADLDSWLSQIMHSWEFI